MKTMRILNFNSSYKKKVRGIKRKTKSMLSCIQEATRVFPEEDTENGYWHLHLPVSQIFIDSDKTPFRVRKVCAQELIARTIHLMNIKPKTNYKIRVMALVSLPQLWDSQIIVFFGDVHYNGFFNRDDEYQTWKNLPEKRNIIKEWGLEVNENIRSIGFEETINDDGTIYKNELWFFGELE
jgi:hypothetical protein